MDMVQWNVVVSICVFLTRRYQAYSVRNVLSEDRSNT